MNKMQNQIAMKLDGVLLKSDGTDITWQEFVTVLESNGLEYTGQSLLIDESGNISVEKPRR
ncbi:MULTISPECIES: hypothetical protein [unclassified Psychrobacillus]|uniref:hypothetical protein n=1 Tax=unclassified Psychrobacillus TaxID=2636677 RepID=UPI0030F5F429